MKQVKTLFVGKDPYNPQNKKYKNLNIDNYPTENVAFFPELTDPNHCLFKITTYRRMIGFIYNQEFTKSEFNKLDSPKKIAKEFMRNDIYFLNASEFELNNNILKTENTELFLNKKTQVLCFGTDAIKKFKSFKSIKKFPHPSPLNNNEFWDDYDVKYKNQNYTKDFIFNDIPYTLK